MRFTDVIGQEDVKNKLIHTVHENRISHAQLFLGGEGSGNLALAIAYAQFINCENKQENDSCGVCKSCTKYEKLIHPDLHFVYPVATTRSVTRDPVSDDFISEWRNTVLQQPYLKPPQWYQTIGVENKQGIIGKKESQEIIRKLNLKSFEAEFKVMIIWMPEKMNPTSANKLLKMIEEPPVKTLFLLVSEDTTNILATILSRTQLVKIPRIKTEVLSEALERKFGLAPADSRSISRIANGNYLEALNLIQSTEQTEYNFEKFVLLMRICYTRKLMEVFNWVDEVAGLGRERQKSFFQYALRMIRENFMMTLSTNEVVYLSEKETGFSQKFHPFINDRNALNIANELERAQTDIERNGYAKIVLLDLALKIMKLIKQ
jgi:DNA polymerase-3 subunit delta'